MNVRCPNCQVVFKTSQEKTTLLNYAIQKGQKLVMLECPECFKVVPINPSALLAKVSQKDNDTKQQYDGIDCPICLDGIVSYVDDNKEVFWGCGECGMTWTSESEIEKDINS
ncbi:hypothetical protein [Myroides marinus]|uniref:hypothetical protein n=1 Tax=Myroides marinus TaxID=703342 RepID=UPI0025787709|nr:hypothetical protein [Myroides marinus]MDM1368889.1 hypothetical protein [Myroides marinus]MDM1375629.1 hypothetical protein [Myroides marinus]MDM1382855.1 hypothetical protein [Myroides marinus]